MIITLPNHCLLNGWQFLIKKKTLIKIKSVEFKFFYISKKFLTRNNLTDPKHNKN